MKRSFKLKTIIFFLLLIVVVIFNGIFLISSYQQSRLILKDQALVQAQRTMGLIKDEFEDYLDKMERDFVSVSSHFTNKAPLNKQQLKTEVLQWENLNGVLNYDFLLFSETDSNQCLMITHLLVNLGETECIDIRAAINDDLSQGWRIISDRKNILNIYVNTLEDKISGRVIGYIIGGIVLSGNTFLLEKISSNPHSQVDSIALYYNQKLVASTGIFERLLPINEGTSTQENSVDVYSRLPLFQDDIRIGIRISNDTISTLKNSISKLVWYGGMLGLAVSAIIAMLLSSAIDRSLQSLLWFTQHARKDRRTEWRNTHIEDFDEIGREIVSIVQDLKQNKHELKGTLTKLEEAYKEKRTMLHHLINKQEIERTKIARELHDDMGQSLTAVRVNITMLGTSSGLDDNAKSLIKQTQDTLNDIYDTVYNRIMTLRPFELDSFGLAKSIPHISVIKQLKNLGYEIILELDQCTPLDSKVEINLYRIAQESLTNVIKHAKGSEVEICLFDTQCGIKLIIKDNGIGIEQHNKQRGYGLNNIKERAEYINGNLTINTDNCTEIIVDVPARYAYK